MSDAHGSVVVVGAGVAGAAAAIAAARAGARVTVVDGGTGASTLATGALDLRPWDASDPPASHDAHEAALGEAPRAVLGALDAYVVGERPARLLTTSGVVRRAFGYDAALLDVSARDAAPRGATPRGRVAVVRCSRPGWDAESLAGGWREAGADAFVAIDAAVLRYGDERALPDADFAARHDDDGRIGWLADRLRDALARANGAFGAIVLPSCLGVRRGRALDLSRRAGIACGEAVGMPGGPAGLRFEHARDRAFASLGIERVSARATSVMPSAARGARWLVATTEGDAREGGSRRGFAASTVVLALGGILGGGLEYAPSESIHGSTLPPFARPPLRPTLDAPVHVGAFGRPLDLPGSLFGTEPESLAWPFARDALLDRAGVLVDAEGACVGGPGEAVGVGIFAAGDFTADAARAWLRALASGADAGVSAARLALSAPAVGRHSAPPSGPASRS